MRINIKLMEALNEIKQLQSFLRNPITELDEGCNMALSRFYQDYSGNIDRFQAGKLRLSKETYSELKR